MLTNCIVQISIPGKNFHVIVQEVCVFKWKGTFSQCPHCWSKLEWAASAFALNLADFPLMTHFSRKLLKREMNYNKKVGKKTATKIYY